jgi:cytochrome bd ubiquinol oxidase subunit II
MTTLRVFISRNPVMDYLAVFKGCIIALVGSGIFFALIGVFGLSASIAFLVAGLSLWAAASAILSHVFMLVGAAVVTPIVLAYSAFAYRVFRGRTPEQGWES